jgi:hypothetical protein
MIVSYQGQFDHAVGSTDYLYVSDLTGTVKGSVEFQDNNLIIYTLEGSSLSVLYTTTNISRKHFLNSGF